MIEQRTLTERADDLSVVEAVIQRMCETEEEVSAVKRVLGVEAEEQQVTNGFTPELPIPPIYQPNVDHLTHARGTVARYQQVVDSYPDNDPTPLAERERILRLAKIDLRRLTKEKESDNVGL